MTKTYNQHHKFWMRTCLSIDYGQKVIGLALFCPGRDPYPMPLGRIVRVLPNRKSKALELIWQELNTHIQDESVEVVVLGLPHFTDGKSSKMTEEVQQFGELLQQQFPTLEFYYQDETLTTYEAEERMRNSPKYNFQVDLMQIDALSAAIILEDFVQAKMAK